MTTITINAENIAKLEAAGFSRWTKNGMDRLYVNAETLGLKVVRYRNGNAKEGTWMGSEMYKQELQEIDESKIYIDLADGTLHVKTDFAPSYASDPTVEDVAAAYVESVVAEPEEEEGETSEDNGTETIQLDAEDTINGNFIDAPKQSGKSIDVPTDERITVELDGQTYERTVYERLRWRNSGKCTVRARFVIVNGTNYLV